MKVVKSISICLIILLVLGLAYLSYLFGTSITAFNPLSKDPIISGLLLSSYTQDELKDLTMNPSNYTFTLQEKDNGEEVIEAKSFIINPVDDSIFNKLIANRLIELKTNPISAFQSNYDDGVIFFSQNKLNDTIESLYAVAREDKVPTQNANAVYNKKTGKFTPVSESVGNTVDNQELSMHIINRLNLDNEYDQTINLVDEEIYVQPTITANSDLLKEKIDTLNTLLKTKIQYKSGWRTNTLSSSTYANWLTLDNQGNVIVSREPLVEYLQEVAGKQNLFTSKEEALNKKKVLTGYIINYDDEIVAATNAILSKESTTRTFTDKFTVTIDEIAPIYTAENETYINELKDRLGSEFVYIKIGDQFMWYVKDNEILVATPITTGAKNSHDTPTGEYTIKYKSRNVTLKGKNDDGSEYNSPVAYWMPFVGSIGIHDADNWRSDYGADVYRYNGSHGCVNTPREKCAIIYDNISVQCPVLVEA